MILTQKVGQEVSVYRSRSPTRTALYKLRPFRSFRNDLPERFSKSHCFFRPVISLVVRNYLWYGDLTQGFARVRCPDCHHEYLLAFSCRGRWFFPMESKFLSLKKQDMFKPFECKLTLVEIFCIIVDRKNIF